MNIADLLRPLDFAVILLYLVIVVGLGFYVAYQQRDQTNILLARKSLGWKGIGLSIWATNVGPPFLIGASGIAYTTGMVTANFEWLAWVFLMLCAMVFAPHYLGLNIDTIPQIIKRRFGEATYRLLTVYVLYTVIMLWLGGALYAGGVLVAQIMGWSPTLSIICLIIIATSFTAFGGLAAVVATDSLQTILIIGGTLTLTVLGIVEVGGIEGLIDKTPPDYWVLFKPADSDTFPWTAVIFGYPVLAIWFWCTDQTIVQRMLGARDLHTAQKGALLAGFLKILPPLIFTLPGILCFILYPGLSEPDAAFTTMVGNLLPVGLKGLIIAVLIAALVSTVDSGLNSFSTVFTLDVYVPIIKKGKAVDPQEIKRVGAIATIGAGIFATLWAIAMGGFASGMFELLQGVSSFLAPPMTALFLLTIFWRGTTSRGVIGGFLVGVIICQAVGFSSFTRSTFGLFDAWPHHLWLAFILLLVTLACMIVGSLLTEHSEGENQLESLSDTYTRLNLNSRGIWMGWAVLGLVMASIYYGFHTLSMRTPNPPPALAMQADPVSPGSMVHIYRGEKPTLDGVIAQGEYDDATLLLGVEGWTAQFSPVLSSTDLATKVWAKHDGTSLYFAFDVTDDVIYGQDTDFWLPDENSLAHDLSREGFPWFGDGVELLIAARPMDSISKDRHAEGSARSWQMVAQTLKSRLGGVGKGGLLEGEPRSDLDAWNMYQRWIENGAMEAATRIKSGAEPSGYVIEWRIDFDPCLEIADGKTWVPEMGASVMKLNIAVNDLDTKDAGQENRFNIHHEHWWSGKKNTRTLLHQWGDMTLHPERRADLEAAAS